MEPGDSTRDCRPSPGRRGAPADRSPSRRRVRRRGRKGVTGLPRQSRGALRSPSVPRKGREIVRSRTCLSGLPRLVLGVRSPSGLSGESRSHSRDHRRRQARRAGKAGRRGSTYERVRRHRPRIPQSAFGQTQDPASSVIRGSFPRTGVSGTPTMDDVTALPVPATARAPCSHRGVDFERKRGAGPAPIDPRKHRPSPVRDRTASTQSCGG